MKKISIIIVTFLFVGSLFAQNQANTQKIWKTEQKLQTPESVLYYPKDNILFVSNIAGKPTDKDDTGFISKVDLNGKIIDLKWVKAISAPKGMAINNGKLYVSNIDELVEIDIAKAKITKRYKAPGATFLNDVAINRYGTVFVSDMGKNTIWYLNGNKFEIWLASDVLQKPNGLFCEPNYLLIGNKNYILKVHYKSKQAIRYIENTGSIDGLVTMGDDTYLISDWVGNVYKVAAGKERVKIFSTGDKNINAADIEYIQSKKMLLIPTFFDNRVAAYKIN
ncbi:MAG: hypothetical protein L3J74_06910 [Bacteroidales bacterium]|nr:hypothetical protein [Bacteroidales bacterium]